MGEPEEFLTLVHLNILKELIQNKLFFKGKFLNREILTS